MAEFVKVMGAAQRMCEASKHCAGCGLRVMGGCAIKPDHPLAFDLIAIEKVIMAWDANHPQKTMLDVFYEKFPNAERLSNGTLRICPHHLDPSWGGLCDDGKTGDCRACWAREVEG